MPNHGAMDVDVGKGRKRRMPTCRFPPLTVKKILDLEGEILIINP